MEINAVTCKSCGSELAYKQNFEGEVGEFIFYNDSNGQKSTTYLNADYCVVSELICKVCSQCFGYYYVSCPENYAELKHLHAVDSNCVAGTNTAKSGVKKFFEKLYKLKSTLEVCQEKLNSYESATLKLEQVYSKLYN